MKHLTQDQCEQALRLFWHEGKNLGEVAKALGCGIYDLSPWLYSKQAQREADYIPAAQSTASAGGRDDG